jgi:hypothetical protein
VTASTTVSFYVRAQNEAHRTLTHLELGSSLIVADDPENSRSEWSPSVGRCGAGLGTEYCKIPDLRPNADLTWTVRVRVPHRIGGSSGPVTAGKTVELEAFVKSNTGHGDPLSNVARRSVAVLKRPSDLPFTGAPVVTPLLVAALALVVGGSFIVAGRRRPPGH